MDSRISSFNNGFVTIIKQFSHDFFIVNRQEDFNCTCLTEGTGQADPNCIRCLGTGKRIKIRKAQGACQETGIPATSKSNNHYAVVRKYYVLSNVPLNHHDYIIDDDKIFVINQTKVHRSFGGEKIWTLCDATPKKTDQTKIMSNFKSLIERKRR